MIKLRWMGTPDGLILGTPGAGKSFSAKREIMNAFLSRKMILLGEGLLFYGNIIIPFKDRFEV